MIAALVITTLVWMALDTAATADPHARLPRELATGLALLAVHVAAVEHAARDLTTTPPGRVVRSGPYRFVHPSEVGLLAAAVLLAEDRQWAR